MNYEARLVCAAVLAFAAAARLIFSRWLEKRDQEWLAKHFGWSQADADIAKWHTNAQAAVLAVAALLFAFA